MQEPGGCLNHRNILELIEPSFMALKAQCKNPKQTKSIVKTITTVLNIITYNTANSSTIVIMGFVQ